MVCLLDNKKDNLIGTLFVMLINVMFKMIDFSDKQPGKSSEFEKIYHFVLVNIRLGFFE